MLRRTLCSIACLLFLLTGVLLPRPALFAGELPPVQIGVLAHRGSETARTMWTPTALYLTRAIPQRSFTILPLGFNEIDSTVARGEVEFVLANSSIYIGLEAHYGATRIATMKNAGLRGSYTLFGGVVFCRAERRDLKTLADLRGKSFLAVDETSLGGWQVAWRELKGSGLDPYRDFGRLRFAGTSHDDVVYAVRDGKVDAGTVRTDTLERLAEAGRIELSAFRILNQRREEGFPFVLSTRLYPEWPMAALAHTERELAEQVAMALLNMPHDDPAAKAGKTAGWTIPLKYEPVHELMRELRLPPYQDYGKITLAAVVRLYWPWLVLAMGALLVMIALTLHVLRLNRRLLRAKGLVEEARQGLEQEVRARTLELQTANDGLRRSEELLRAVHENAGIGIAVIGPDLRIKSLNRRLRQWFPHIDAEMKPLCYQSFNTPPRAAPCPYCPTLITLGDGKIHEAVTETPTPSGVRHYRIVSSPLLAADGSVEAAIEVVEDVTERKQIENDLRYAKEKWERTFDAIADPVMILDANYQILKANKAMAGALGITPAQAVGMICYQAVHATQAPPGNCPHARLLADGQACSQEIHEPRLGGHYLISVSPLHAPDGTLVGSIHSARDISALKKVEEMGRKYSRDLEKLLAISRETTMLTEIAGLYRAFVAASKELLGLDFSALLLLSEDKKTLTLQDGLGFPEFMTGHFSLVEGQGLSPLVVKNKRPETVLDFTRETRFEVPAIVGVKGIRSAVAVPMMMQDEVIGVLIGHTLARREFSPQEIDIFQHIANQAAVAIRNATSMDLLKKSEKYVRDITASLGEGVYVVNALGNVTFMNPEAERLLGWTEQELLHKNIHDIVHNRRADGRSLLFEDCGMRQVIASGESFHSADEVFVKKDGAVFPVAVHSAPLLENGKVVASVTAFRDISVRRELEREREKLIAELQQALAEIKTLHGIVPICASCKKIRDDEGAWHQMEVYISKRTDAKFSHGICKDCAKKLYPEYYSG